MASSQLPEDILLEILVRLPAKSLLRLSCVCKSWHELLKNPYFLHKNAAKNPSMIYLRSRRDKSLEYKEQLFEFNSGNPVVSRYARLIQDPVVSRRNSYLRLKTCSCDGILCLENSDDRYYASEGKVCLYNPTTRKGLTLPPSLFDDEVFETQHVGFGFDESCNDYKVIRIRCVRRRRNKEDVIKSKGLEGLTDYVVKRKHVEMYKFSTKRWVELDVGLEHDAEQSDLSEADGALLNGFFYWLYGSQEKASILTFDFHAETFEEIELCDDLKFFVGQGNPHKEHRDLCVAALDDSLSVLSWKCIYDYYERDIPTTLLMVDVWVMEKSAGNESSWTKKFSAELCKFSRLTSMVGVHGTTIFLLCRSHINNGKYALMDCTPEEDDGEGEGCKKLKVRTVLEYDRYLNAYIDGVSFQPSLVSLPESEICGLVDCTPEDDDGQLQKG